MHSFDCSSRSVFLRLGNGSFLSLDAQLRWSLVALLCMGCNTAPAVEREQPQPAQAPKTGTELIGTRVEVAVVRPSSHQMTLSAPGEVEGYRDAALAAPLGGYIEHVAIEEGERVKKGQVLASVDQATHSARLARAKVELESAERELGRAESLSGTIPKAEIDAARDRVALVKAGVKELALNASRALIRAPFSGYAVRVDAEVGEVAPPGAVLIRLVQLSPIKISVALSDRDVAIAEKGSKASIQLDARSGVFEGVVTEVSRAANLKTRSFEAVIEVPNEEEVLLPGMITNVTLKTQAEPESKDQPKQAEQLIISQDWLVTRRDGVGVFIEQGGVAKWRPVKLGDVLRKQVVVQEGLNPGDALIIVGHRDLVDGDPVLVHRRGRCCQEGRVSFSD